MLRGTQVRDSYTIGRLDLVSIGTPYRLAIAFQDYGSDERHPKGLDGIAACVYITHRRPHNKAPWPRHWRYSIGPPLTMKSRQLRLPRTFKSLELNSEDSRWANADILPCPKEHQ